MKLNIKLLAIIILAAVFLTPSGAEGRTYSFTSLQIEAWVREDGSLEVEEQRTVQFDGQFSGMFQWIDTSGGVSVRDVEVAEGSRVYNVHQGRDPGPAGTYFLREDPDSLYIDWSFSALNETRTFTLRYILDGVVLVHQDVAELYYQFVGEEWEQQTERVTVTLRLPSGASAGDVRAWGHGPLSGTVEILNPQTVRWKVDPLPAKTMLEGRTTFPVSLVPLVGSNVRTGRTALPSVLAEEERWAGEANRQRLYSRIDWILGILLMAAAIVGAIWSWFRWGKEYSPEFQGEYYRDLPADYSPAEMAVLYTPSQINTKDLTATIMDLARRKSLRIEEETTTSKGLLRKKEQTDYILTRTDNDNGKLKEHEQFLLDFLFSTVDQEKTGRVSFKDLELFAKKKRTSFARFWQDWKKKVKGEAAKRDFFDKSVGSKQKLLLGLGVFGFLAAIPGFVLGFLATGFALLGSGVVLLIGGAVIHRRSRNGVEEFVKWRAFRRFLMHFSNMKEHEIPSLVVWEHYLVFAISLGVAKQVIKQLQLVYPGLEDGNYRFGYGWWYMSMHNSRGIDASLSQLTTSLQSSIQQSISTATSQSSSGSGSGGGFSGGGGGGFGGGGGGVR